MPAPALQLNRVEAGRRAQLTQGRRAAYTTGASRSNPLPSGFSTAANDDVESANDDVETADNPVFGEEDFVDKANVHKKSTGGGEMGAGGEEQAPSMAEADDTAAMEGRRRGDLIRAQAASNQQSTQDESNAAKNGAKDAIKSASAEVFDMGVNKLVLAGWWLVIPVILWFDIKLFVGNWIMDGKGFIKPLTWGSIGELFSPKAKGVTKKAVESAGVPDIALHILLIFVNILILVAGTMQIALWFIIIYAMINPVDVFSFLSSMF